MNKETAIPVLLAGVIGAVFSMHYARYWGDHFARIIGYPLAIFAIPTVFFLFLITIQILILPQLGAKTIFKTSWLWLVIAVLLSNTSVLVLLRWFFFYRGDI